jgi:hypothetical protein
MSTTRRTFLIASSTAIASGLVLPDQEKHIIYSIPAENTSIWVPLSIIVTSPPNTRFETIGFDPYTQWVKIINQGQCGELAAMKRPNKLILVKDRGIVEPRDGIFVPMASELLTDQAQQNNYLGNYHKYAWRNAGWNVIHKKT